MWRPGPAHRWHPTQGDGTTARGSFPTFGIQSHTDACTHVGAVVRWDRFSTIEKRRWGCAGCHAPSARVRESDDATARAVCRPSVSVHTDACTQSWRRRSVDCQIFDHPETVMGLRRLARAVCEGVRARWRDGAGSLLTLGIRSLRCLHTHLRGRSMGGRRDGLLSIEKQWWDGARGSTKSARVSESDGATSQAVWLPLVSGCTDGCTHLSVGGGLHRFSGIEIRCWDCAGGRAQSARVLESATARRRRLCAGLGCFQSHRCVRTSWRGRWT